MIIIFGVSANRFFNAVDIAFILSYTIYLIFYIGKNPKNIRNIYRIALFLVYVWLIFLNVYILPGFKEGGILHYGIYILILVIRFGSVVTALIFNSKGRKLLTGSFRLQPAQSFVIGFLLLILTGALILTLPVSVSEGEDVNFINALFTSTSAVCVTGLIVEDTGTYFSQFGQIIILLLIQLGGLGIMTFSSFIIIILVNKISFADKATTMDIYDQNSIDTLKALIKTIILGTLLIEFIGFVLLFLSTDASVYAPEIPSRATFGYKVYFSLFHSVSAFCNAGFSLNADNLMSATGNVGVNFTIMSLIVLGGIGFPVMLNLRNYFRYLLKAKVRKSPAPNEVVKLQTKVVISVTIALILIGVFLFLLMEWNHSLKGSSIPLKFMQAFFQSVTTRTAGFNTIDFGDGSNLPLKEVTYLIMILLMFIGASPGSTGGGIKTTTFFVLLKTSNTVIKGGKVIRMFKKRISYETVYRSIGILFSYLGLIFGATFILFISEKGFNLTQILFEVVSAIATVGLSTGITSSLSPFGRVVITIVMFTGRIGVLTFLYVIIKSRKEKSIKYPEDTLSIG
jgi:trk system potassium uptake protein